MDTGDAGIKQAKETMSVSSRAGTTWPGHRTSRPVNCDSTQNLPLFTQRQSSVPKARHLPLVRALEGSGRQKIRQYKEIVLINNPWT